MVGTVGKILGDSASTSPACRSRVTKGGHALVALSVDSAIPGEVLEEIRGAIDADTVRGVSLTE